VAELLTCTGHECCNHGYCVTNISSAYAVLSSSVFGTFSLIPVVAFIQFSSCCCQICWFSRAETVHRHTSSFSRRKMTTFRTYTASSLAELFTVFCRGPLPIRPPPLLHSAQISFSSSSAQTLLSLYAFLGRDQTPIQYYSERHYIYCRAIEKCTALKFRKKFLHVFYVRGSLHREPMSINFQDATMYSLL
jgi:hypothetical protein